MPDEITTYTFPEELLKELERHTLRELFETPATQPWAVSMLSNAVKFADAFEDDRPGSLKLELLLNRIDRKIPTNWRVHLFRICQTLHSSRKVSR